MKNLFAHSLKEHSRICRSFFSEIRSGREIYIRFERKADYVNNRDSSYEARYVRAEIATDHMLQYDLENLAVNEEMQPNRPSLSERYRPYMVSFLTEVPENKEILSGEWFTANFQSIGNAGSIAAEAENTVYEGVLEYSASPVRYEKGRLIIFKNKSIPPDIQKKINSMCKDADFAVSTDGEIESILNSAWNKAALQTIDIYNLGKGNSDYIRGKGSRILYDIGYSYREFPGLKKRYRYYKACGAIRSAKPSCVILSHWDMDHIIGCVYARQSIFEVPWIAPCLEGKTGDKPSLNAYRLARYLNCLRHLWLAERSRCTLKVARIECGGGFMDLYRGAGRDSKITKVNSEGLYLNICSDSQHILLAGDVPYLSMAPEVWGIPIDFLHVPHHCSDMNLKDLIRYSGYGAAAVVSTNWKIDKGRGQVWKQNMDEGHRTVLEDKFAKVVCTTGNNVSRIDQWLSYQIYVRQGTAKFR